MSKIKPLLKIVIPDKGKHAGKTLCTLTAEGEQVTELMLGAMKTFYRALRAYGMSDKEYEKFIARLALVAGLEVDKEDKEFVKQEQEKEIWKA